MTKELGSIGVNILILFSVLFLTSCVHQVTMLYESEKPAVYGEEKLIKFSPPIYPPDARASGVEGSVLVKYSINSKGVVENPIVVDAYPDTRFSSAAIKSVLSHRYKPRLLNKTPVRVAEKFIRVTFVISGESVMDIPIDEVTCKNGRPVWVNNKKCTKIQ